MTKKILYKLYMWNIDREMEWFQFMVDIPKSDKMIRKQYYDGVSEVVDIEQWEIGKKIKDEGRKVNDK